MSKDPSPVCDKCQEDLTVQHVIRDCPGFWNFRNTWSILNNLDEALNEDNDIKIIKFATKINIVNNPTHDLYVNVYCIH